MHRLGEFELHAVRDGVFRLDGGAMFGIVPKPVWEKLAPADERNRIALSLTCLLIRTGKQNVLVDTGIGDKHDQRFVDLYAIDRRPTLVESLASAGVRPDEIDLVIFSHLHFDHAGGATVRSNGGLVPAFPKATYVVQEGMWAEALEPNPRTKGSYMQDDFLPLEKAGRVRFVNGEEEVAPGIRVRRSGGHVKNHQVVLAESGGRTAIFWADLLPTSAHVKPAWVMGYDLYPAEVALIKQEMVRQSMEGKWVNVFEHDPAVAMAYFIQDDKGVRVDPIEPVSKPR